MNKLIKYIFSISISSLAVVGIIYAANITLLTQTAVTGDKITATWVNAVNSKLNLVGNSTCTVSNGWAGNATYKNYEVFVVYDNCGNGLSQCLNGQVKVIYPVSTSGCGG